MSAPRKPSDALSSSGPLAVRLLVAIGYAVWFGSQWTARELRYHSVLGAPIYHRPPSTVWWWRAAAGACATVAIACAVGRRRAVWFASASAIAWGVAIAMAMASVVPIYSPMTVAAFAIRTRRIAAAAPVREHGVVAVAASVLVCLVVALITRPRRRARTPSVSHGSASWSAGASLARASGLVIARAVDDDRPRRHSDTRASEALLRFEGDGHLLTVAPTRSGKGVGAVIPNLLTYPGSVVVTDVKGENYAVTGRARARLGHVVIALDPFGITDAPDDSFNPLDMIDASGDDAVDDAMLIADMLVVPLDGAGGEATFWNEEARAFLAGLILHVAVTGDRTAGRRSLPEVRRLIAAPEAEFARTLAAMQARAQDRTVTGELVARAASRFLQKADKERSGVVSTAQSHTHFLDSPRMRRVLQSSPRGFTLDRLKTEPISLYFVLPAERLTTYPRWLRLMIAVSLLAMKRSRARPAHRVLFLLDEFAHLGRMRPVEDDIALVAGYGATFWLFVQDLSQLKALYRDKWETFAANVQVLQAFGVNDTFTANHLSARLGDATILVESENVSAGVSHGRGRARQESAAQTTAEKGRRLLTPDEVLRLPADEQLLFVRGESPLRARKLDYLRDPEFAGLAAANPMYEPAVAAPW